MQPGERDPRLGGLGLAFVGQPHFQEVNCMKVVALKPTRYGKDKHAPEEVFEIADRRHALVLIAAGMVKEEEDAPAQVTKRRRYKRRDMAAEGSSP